MYVLRYQVLVVSHIDIVLSGNTGQGKSSLLNALVEQNFLPTSDLGACTSAVVEVSLSDSCKFEAQVQFISTEVSIFLAIGIMD